MKSDKLGNAFSLCVYPYGKHTEQEAEAIATRIHVALSTPPTTPAIGEVASAREYLLSQGLDPEAIKAEGRRRLAPLLAGIQGEEEQAIRTRISNLPSASQWRADAIVLLTLIDRLREGQAATPAPVLTQQQSDGWIAVEDGLPEERGAYIVVNKRGTVSTEWYSATEKCFVVDAGISPDEVTHWQPLPPTPQKGQDNG